MHIYKDKSASGRLAEALSRAGSPLLRSDDARSQALDIVLRDAERKAYAAELRAMARKSATVEQSRSGVLVELECQAIAMMPEASGAERWAYGPSADRPFVTEKSAAYDEAQPEAVLAHLKLRQLAARATSIAADEARNRRADAEDAWRRPVRPVQGPAKSYLPRMDSESQREAANALGRERRMVDDAPTCVDATQLSAAGSVLATAKSRGGRCLPLTVEVKIRRKRNHHGRNK